MKKILLTIVAFAALTATTQAALIAHWGFDTYTSGDYGPVSPDDGLQSTAGITVDPNVPANKLNSVPGTTLNDTIAAPGPSQAIQFQGSQANRGSITIHLSGVGMSAFSLTYAALRSQSGPTANHWSYSVDGGASFSDVGVVQPGTLETTFSVLTVDLSGVSALNGAADILLQGTFESSGGNATYDNYQVLAAVPEPVNVALALFGLGVVGLKFGRRLFSFVRR